jgi:RNA polymerase sigma factor (sigma-70 family)
MTTRLAQSKWRSLDALFSAGSLGALTDRELLERFRTDRGAAGQEAFRILVERHGPMVLGLCRSLIVDPHDAEDAFQATFLVLVRKGENIWVRDSLGPWLYGVASRVARRARRRRTLQRRCEVPLRDDVAVPHRNASPILDGDTHQVIQQEIASLPASLRAPIVLCSLAGLTYDDAARQLGLSEPTLRGRLHRARRKLASRLRDCGLASGVPAAAMDALRLAMPPLPSALVNSTVQHASGWSSVSGLAAAERAIPAAIANLARGVLQSMLLSTVALLGLAAVLIAGVLGTAVLAQHTKVRPSARPARAISTPIALPQNRPADPAQAGQKPASRALPQQFQALVLKHEQNQKQIQTLKCSIDERVSFDGGKTWRVLVTWKVCKSGPKERIHSTSHRVLRGGETFEVVKPPLGETDVLFAPDAIRSMAGYDPTNPPDEPVTMLHEMTTNRIGGMIKPAQPFAPGGYKTGLAADYLLGTLLDVMYSVRDLCEADVNAASQPAERRDADGHVLHELKLKAPPGHQTWDIRHELPEGKYYSYVVTLSLRHGNAVIQSVRTTRVDKSERAGKADLEIHDRFEVIEFQEPAPGVFLAKTIRRKRIRSDEPDNPSFILETSIHDVQVNGPIAEKDLAFRYPKGIGVADVAKNVFYIWGDGAPAETLTAKEYNDRRQAEMLNARNGQLFK